MSHTPLPWKYIEGHDNCPAEIEDGVIQGTICSADGWHVARIWANIPGAEGNGDLISRACNSHAALVEALGMAEKYLGEYRMRITNPEGITVGEIINNALALAKGEKP